MADIQSPASRAMQQDLLRTRFNVNRRGALQPGPDLSGGRGLGRSTHSRTFVNGQKIAEAVGFYVNTQMNQAAPIIYQRMVRERLSAPKVMIGRGKYLQKNPLSAGLRQISGKLLGSLRVRAFTPGTTKRGFRGVYRILSQIGGASLGNFDYAVLHEKKGRLQFMRVTGEEYERVRAEVRGGASQIALRAGAKVS